MSFGDSRPITDRIREWYRGVYVPPRPPDPYSRVLIFEDGRYEQPPLARALRIMGRFWLNHWKWIIGTLVAVLGILAALWH